MIGIIVILAVSWLLLYLLEKKDIRALGLFPISKSLLQLLIGFLFLSSINFLTVYTDTLIRSIEWNINPSINADLILSSLWYHTKSALTEDLVFRGAILFILISRIGQKMALMISAIAFGVYHWFSYGMIGGGIIPMIFVFVITGSMGWVWAYTFARTKSIMMPLGFHIGWNFVSTLFYEASPYGELIFQINSFSELSEMTNLIFQIFKGLAPPIIIYYFVRYGILNQNSMDATPSKK